MNNTNIRQLGDAALLLFTREVSARCNHATAELLLLLGEVEARGLHLERGFSSMHYFCTVELNLSDAEAANRLDVARLMRRFPQLADVVREGRVHLTGIRQIGRLLTDANFDELIGKVTQKSKRQIDEFVVTLAPKPLVEDSLRKLPTPRLTAAASSPTPPLATSAPEPRDSGAPRVTAVSGTSQVTSGSSAPTSPASVESRVTSAKASVGTLFELKQSTARPPHASGSMAPPTSSQPQKPAQPAVAVALLPAPAPRPHDRIEPLTSEAYGVHFTADKELRDLLLEAQALLRHRNPRGEFAPILRSGLKLLVAKVKKEQYGIGAKRRVPREKKGEPATHVSPNAMAGAPESAPESSAHAAGLATQAQPKTDAASIDSATAETSPGAKSKSRRPRDRKPSRHIPYANRRDLCADKEDSLQCEFVSEEGRRCEERGWLQIDHVNGFARNPDHSASALRLLCAGHNAYMADKMYGRDFMQAARQRFFPERVEEHVASYAPMAFSEASATGG